MSGQPTYDASFDIRQSLAAPDELSLKRTRRSGVLPPQMIHTLANAADFFQITMLGVGANGALSPNFTSTVAQHAFGVGLIGMLLAIFVRRATKPIGSEYTDSNLSVAARAVVSTSLGLGLLTLIDALRVGLRTSPHADALLLAWVAASGLLSFLIWLSLLHVISVIGRRCRIVVVGPAQPLKDMSTALEQVSQSAWDLAGTIDDGEPDGLDRLVSMVDHGRVDVVAIATADPGATDRISAICARLSDRPVRVSIGLDLMALTAGLRRGGNLGQFHLTEIRPVASLTVQGVAKRVLDVMLGGSALLLLAPVMLAAAAAIRIETQGPIFFKQWRFGAGSRPIAVMKFRTMHVKLCDATGGERTQARDRRVTKVGRFLRRLSIDELPQLFNVLRGNMSMVGPRPHPMHMNVDGIYYFDLLNHYRGRHVVQPGITGWAQVNGSRGAVDTVQKAERRLALDLWYIEHWSLWLDLRILAMTVFSFVSASAD